jgi:Asp-tRNA(Asn)/Glu-tRNA(Gln) amidotransferase A subunit family amidase
VRFRILVIDKHRLCPKASVSTRPLIADRGAPHRDRRQITSRLDAQLVWPEFATTSGFPATVAPIDRSESGVPIGVQIIEPYPEGRATIAFAEPIEQESSVVSPPGFGADCPAASSVD